MWSQVGTGIRINLLLTILAGVLYPLAITGICQIVFPHQANGSLIEKGNRLVGSELIGQSFSGLEYFQPRPSGAGANGYDASASGASNLGPTSAKLILGSTKMDAHNHEVVDFDGISLRLVHYCLENALPYQSSMPLDRFRDAKGTLDDVALVKAFNKDKGQLTFVAKTPIPADAVTGSASGLDPHISPANAYIQAIRVAKYRGISVEQAKQLVAQMTEAPSIGIFGDPRVNVLRLNLALERQFPISRKGK
jgi:potassium-transporting ATPase KdpC subunit